MTITKIKLKKHIFLFLWIIISLSLINCKPPNPFMDLQKKVVQKNKKKLQDILEIKGAEKERVKSDTVKLRRQNVYKKKPKQEKKFSLKTFLNRDILSITKTLGNPSLIIKHRKIKNFQYHFQSCYLDLFFVKKKNKFIVKHFETRSPKLNSNIIEKKCFKEISKSIKN